MTPDYTQYLMNFTPADIGYPATPTLPPGYAFVGIMLGRHIKSHGFKALRRDQTKHRFVENPQPLEPYVAVICAETYLIVPKQRSQPVSHITVTYHFTDGTQETLPDTNFSTRSKDQIL